MRLRGLDLNLLLALDALLTLRNVTAAASKLNVTQPTLSGSLSRLRDHFQDQLLVRAGAGMELTPMGEMLLEPVQEALELVDAVASMRPNFDPTQDHRHFNLYASDYVIHSLLTEVIQRVAMLSPRVTVKLLHPNPAGLAEQLRKHKVDFIFTLHSSRVPEHPHSVVIRDTLCCVVWKENRRVGTSMSLDLFLELGHVVARFGEEQRAGFDEWVLQAKGIQRREEISTPSALSLGALVVGSDRVAVLPLRVAEAQATLLPLKILPPPVELPPIEILMQWSSSRANDRATQWLRDLILQVAQEKEMSIHPAIKN